MKQIILFCSKYRQGQSDIHGN